MRVTPSLSIAAASLWLPDTVSTAEEAAARGAVRLRTAREEGIVQLPQCHDRTVPGMVLEAARAALARAGRTAGDIDLLLHSWAFDRGQGHWLPHYRIAGLLGSRRCHAVGIRQECNGGAGALEAGAARMIADRALTTVLITSGDNFTELHCDRWRGMAVGTPLGDGAAALVLTRGAGPLVVEAIASVSDPSIESDFPSRDPFTPPGGADLRPLAEVSDNWRIQERLRSCLERAALQVLEETGIAPSDPSIRVVLPARSGRTGVATVIIPALPAPLREKVRLYGSHTGHLGAGDLLANVADVLDGTPPPPGSRALFLSTGMGSIATCLLVRAEDATGRHRPGAAPARRSGEPAR
ncbi:beta-ketoacyl-[acyl-carrier-protein] synthase family protein [Streptomyces yaizuensis]|uniref:Ketoacyl-ACP synthase III family protein n=1 Tax=Streptomyces yaizuensis TaxID=2989713 RepID=A0ABQ5NXM7_9ACTN|nr:hypothetical protein [Streptomyces sp. YSPA8]GLF95129.1 ketoacyl-ACP synthase III family protein [Streptomyces sp. YSPA8]